MNGVEFVLFNLALVAGLMTLLWAISLPLRDASIVDPAWGLVFVAIAWSTFIRHPQPGPGIVDPSPLIVALVTIWGLRLSIYLGWRNLGKGEDFRYVRMRERFGSRFPAISLVVVFLLQAGIAWVVSLPIQVAQASYGVQPPITVLLVAGLALWALGLAFETVGDLQLARFKRDPSNRGKVMDRGLWRYTRHPNYFGDCCVWWGLYLIAASAGAWWTIVGPVVMTIFLVRISGAGLLERSIVDRRPGYAEYMRRTSGFVPRPPRD